MASRLLVQLIMKPNTEYNSTTARFPTACGALYIITVEDEKENIIKVLFELGKAGTCPKAHLTVLSEYINSVLKNPTSAEIVSALSNLTGITCSGGDSCMGVAVHYLLEKILNKNEVKQSERNK